MIYLLALAAGALLPFSLAPFDIWPLGLLALAGWFWLLRSGRIGGALSGWLFGLGKYGVGASWVYVSIHVYGNASPPLAALLVLLFVAGLALFMLVNGWAFERLKTGTRFGDAFLFAALFSGFEWLLTWFLTGFPWLFAGYAHMETVLAGWAPVGGVLLMGFWVALAAALLVVAIEALRERQRPAAGVAAAIALLPWLLGWALGTVTWVEDGPRRDVALVQGNVQQSVKWEPEMQWPILRTYQDLSEPHWGVDLMIWPEAAITFIAHEATEVLEDLGGRARSAGTALVLGLPTVERIPGGDILFRNSASVLGVGSGRYDKRRLVPFGEYVPLESILRGAIQFFDMPMSRASPGAWTQPLLDLGGYQGIMAICYEVVYPDLVRAQAQEADVLITISNDTWFGASIGPLQHLQMARMRALENGRWMLRGTNNGVTAIIDHTGAVRGALPQFEAGTLRGEYRLMQGTTPFTRLGHAPTLLILAVILAYAAWRRLPYLARRPAAGGSSAA
jgi:apolipoprotein N-acyltransferase